jgi:hypothetical protein
MLKKFKTLLLSYFIKRYFKTFSVFAKNIAPLIKLFKFFYHLRVVLLLITIWRLHGFLYTLASFLLVVVLGYDIIDFLNLLGIIYSAFITYFIEFKINLINRIFNLFYIQSVENMVQTIEKHFAESKISRSGQNNNQDSVLPNSSNNKTPVLSSAESADPQVKLFRHKYLINPRPNFTDYSFYLTDIITSKYFYIPVIVILSCYGISYHNEILTSVSTGVNIVSNTILDWYNWWFNIRPGGGPTDLLNTNNNTQNLVNSVVDKSPDISRPNTPIIDSIRVEETWNSNSSTPTGSSSPNSTGSSTPTNTISLTPMQEEFNKYFREP